VLVRLAVREQYQGSVLQDFVYERHTYGLSATDRSQQLAAEYDTRTAAACSAAIEKRATDPCRKPAGTARPLPQHAPVRRMTIPSGGASLIGVYGRRPAAPQVAFNSAHGSRSAPVRSQSPSTRG